ncbi:HPt domain-containing protein [Fusarium keratoplasticum]|uniref:HPt domain-containing protein n=1 Tax=Fusarium keratoplasticum TaxID=1328300 RepID=A0ACC0QPX7_9HYPO|nr:HPt domain-containing protein [Fusarium keratoplasticum]KAI8660791.1 HPt domain-containing protein [Fusarium keratoplasticum]KAI8661818.1 HPt domain-containing protein [Fusarium keratoplasticum]
MSPAEDNKLNEGSDLGDGVDMITFSQILEMDDPDDHDFSSSIVFGFFEQAEETFTQIDEALEKRDLDNLSSLGHFLKGSSATLGLVKVRDGCEKIQRYGKHENVDGTPEPDEQICLAGIQAAFDAVKKDYAEVEKALRKYYEGLEKND